MAANWFERLLDTVADHGREIIGLRDADHASASPLPALCDKLVTGRGEASNIALAREILRRWQAADESQKLEFLELLATRFNPDPAAVRAAIAQYAPDDHAAMQRLAEAAEPPRQELLRRLNMAPGGTAVLVRMRDFLLRAMPKRQDKRAELRHVDSDFQHLLSSWFNRGFLRVQRIDWRSPAALLEKIINYETVHPMGGWDDLRRRLAADRRCFAFFHPALPDEPLIFVEVALTRALSDNIAPLIDPAAAELDPQTADTAIFYSINNTLRGLRGVSFGNFLIKQVATDLKNEFPHLKTFATLSPAPGLRRYVLKTDADTLRAVLATEDGLLDPGRRSADAVADTIDALLRQAADGALADDKKSSLRAALERLTLFYLAAAEKDGRAIDPVAHFHLSNGARLERVNVFANMSRYGLRQSFGCMCNYFYDNARIVANHEAYSCGGGVTLSRQLEKKLRAIRAADTRTRD